MKLSDFKQKYQFKDSFLAKVVTLNKQVELFIIPKILVTY